LLLSGRNFTFAIIYFGTLNEFRESVLIALATPLYVIVIGAELVFSWLNDKKYYSTHGIISNMYLMLLNMTVDVLLRGVCLVVLNSFYQYHLFTVENVIVYWLVLLLAQDFLYYLLHVVDHHCRIFWAIHVTHHSSEEFNFTVGFRSSVFQPLYRFLYFIPLSMAGFKSIDIMFIYSAVQIYGILLHTQAVGKLGVLEYILVTPSHHRVHHGSNKIYIDKNMGMLLIIWDRIFGTFQKETEVVRYGLTTPVGSNHPFNVVFHEWKNMLLDVKSAKALSQKFKYLFFKPGWHPAHRSKTTNNYQQETDQPLNFSSESVSPLKTA
jgi:sterol desaturase/sphingolipid hydroxylase (fatty acid hydroxylase superfamily)